METSKSFSNNVLKFNDESFIKTYGNQKLSMADGQTQNLPESRNLIFSLQATKQWLWLRKLDLQYMLLGMTGIVYILQREWTSL